MGVKIAGAAEFGRKLEALPEAAKAEIRGALNENADRMVGLARSLAPRDEGDLLDSIRAEPGGHELQVKVTAGGEKTTRPVREGASATYDYAMAQEFGTEHQPAHPYFWVSYRALRPAMRRRIAKAVRAAVQKLGGST